MTNKKCHQIFALTHRQALNEEFDHFLNLFLGFHKKT